MLLLLPALMHATHLNLASTPQKGALRAPRGVLSGRDPEILSLVDPLLPLLVRALAGAAG